MCGLGVSLTMAKLKVEGFKDLEAALLALPRSTARNVSRRAMAKALAPVESAAKAAAPRDSGQLADSITVSTKLSKRQASQNRKEAVRLGISRDALIMHVGANALPHAHLIEFGTGPRYHKSGKYVGRVAPQPFMRPAWDANRQGVLDSLSQSIRAEIDKTLARAARRAARNAKRA